MSLLWLRQLPGCGDWTPPTRRPRPALVLPLTEGRSSPTNTPVFPPSSFILLSFAWFYIFFSSGQELLSSLSWCSACTSVSEGVFLMYPWREMYSMSTYSSTILLSPVKIFNKKMIFKIFQGFCLKRTNQHQQCRTYVWVPVYLYICWYTKILST